MQTDRAASPALTRQAWVLFAALCLSVAMVGGVGYYITAQDAPGTAAEPPFSPVIFLAMGFVFVVVGGAIRVVLLSPARLDEKLNADGAIAHAQTLTFNIMTWAFTEAMAVFGLVATLTTRDPQWVGAAAGIALAAMVLWHRPRFGRPQG